MKGKTILVTGGAGFIGSNFIHYLFREHPGVKVINLDLLTYAGNLENLKAWEDNPDYRFVKGDIADAKIVNGIVPEADYIVNFAAESHVDRSIEDPSVFIRTNVMGTQVLLDAARKHEIKRYLQISTDEVYGSLGPTGYFTEATPLAPNSPYSASKAGADLLAAAYFETYGLPVLITRCSNNYGPYQFPEKLIPFFIKRLLNNQTVPVYGDGLNIRDWLHVEDHCSAIDAVLQKGSPGQVYNIGGNNEKTNMEITKFVLAGLNKPESMIEYVKDRLGHDRRYAIDSSKTRRELGWEPKIGFDEGIKQTIAWYLDNREWWEKL
ncbi:MAG: dTDP-glucose 4,6-dehydratase [Eubacteriales bacterium]